MAAVGLLSRLVAFDTVSERSNRELIDFVAAYLSAHGVEPLRVPADEGGKAGLIATVGPALPGGIVLSGHTDVVPVEGQAWSSDPFVLTEREGRLYGRGSADMKGFIACVLALLPGWAELRVPVHLVLSWDEEVGCLGAPKLIAELLARVPRPAAVIVGEPTGMRVCDRHRGIAVFRTSVTGRGGHSSAPGRGVNAIAAAARIVNELVTLNVRSSAAAGASIEDAPEHTTINVGRIEGGAAVNMIAERCQIGWECRPGAGETADSIEAALQSFVTGTLLPEMRGIAAQAGVGTERLVSVPPLRRDEGSRAVDLACRFGGQNRCFAAPFASEAGLFQAAGIPAAVVGPGFASEAHQPDEFVSREQLARCLDFLGRLGRWAAAAPCERP